jgi:hypothetical protein
MRSRVRVAQPADPSHCFARLWGGGLAFNAEADLHERCDAAIRRHGLAVAHAAITRASAHAVGADAARALRVRVAGRDTWNTVCGSPRALLSRGRRRSGRGRSRARSRLRRLRHAHLQARTKGGHLPRAGRARPSRIIVLRPRRGGCAAVARSGGAAPIPGWLVAEAPLRVFWEGRAGATRPPGAQEGASETLAPLKRRARREAISLGVPVAKRGENLRLRSTPCRRATSAAADARLRGTA